MESGLSESIREERVPSRESAKTGKNSSLRYSRGKKASVLKAKWAGGWVVPHKVREEVQAM